MVKFSLKASVQEGRLALSRHPIQAACLGLAMAGLASVNLVAATALFGPMADSPYIQFLLQTNELLALALAIYAAYKWDTSLGMGAILLFLALMAPSFAVQFLANFPRLFHLQLVALITLFGIWLIAELRRALEVAQRREREISAMAGLNAQVFNERARLMEEAGNGRAQLARLLQGLSLSSPSGASTQVGATLLHLIQDVVGADSVSLTLVKADGAPGERVDRFRGFDSFAQAGPPGELDKMVLSTWSSQYIPDTRAVAWASPVLVGSGIMSCLGLPVKSEKRLIGVVSFYSNQPDAFRADAELLESIAGLLAGPLLRAELHNDIGSMLYGAKAPVPAPVPARPY